MSWTTPITYTTGNTLTAAQQNTYIRDNTNFLHDPPMCLAQRGSNLSVTTATNTKVSMTGEQFDTDTMHDTVTNNTRITCNTAGVYLIWATAVWNNASGGRRVLEIWLNGSSSSILSGDSELSPSAGDICELSAVATWQMNATDYVEMNVIQSSGGNLNILGTGSGNQCYLGAQWQGTGT